MKLLIAIFVAFTTTLNALSFERPAVSSAFDSPHHFDRLPLIIAHKSYAPGLPPNTIAAIDSILKTDVGGIECDVQLSQDGIPIVFHDDELQEMTTGVGTVAAHPADALKRMFYIDREAVTEHGIPTLEDVFKVVGKSKMLFLDIKDSSMKDTGIASALAVLISRYDLHQNVVVESFNPVFLHRIKKIDPRITIQYNFLEDATATEEESPEQLAGIPWILKNRSFIWLVRNYVRPDILGVRFSVPVETIQKLAEHGYPIIAWTVDDSEQAKSLLDAGVRGIQTNKPVEMQKILQPLYPTLVQDASRLDLVKVSRVIDVIDELDILSALNLARLENRKVSIAGAQHTMGGHTFAPDNIVLKMHKYNKMSYSTDRQTLTVQSGATWENVQKHLNSYNRSVMVMQSDTIFTVGGSLSANVHGWQVGSGPIASTVKQFRLMLANGEIVTCSREGNADLFKACLGGYGMFGVILDVELQTCQNYYLQKESKYFPSGEFPDNFKSSVSDNETVKLAYGRLSISNDKLLQEASLNTYRMIETPQTIVPISKEKIADFKRKILRLSEISEAGKQLRWMLEKEFSIWLEKGYQTRNSAMSPDIHVLWPERVDSRDILQEYFVPKNQYDAFLTALKTRVQELGMNLLNVTIREVRQDEDSLLAYAQEDVFAFVLLFSQKMEEEEKMRSFSQRLIDDVLALGGNFYLPYRLHYTRDQFKRAYPMHQTFMDLKRYYDPEERFSCNFWMHISSS